MGFKPEKTIYKLKFDDSKYNGLEVRAKSVPIGDMMSMVKLADFKNKNSKSLSPEDLQTIDELFGIFGNALVDWNLEDDDDKPIPATKGGLYTQEFGFVMDVILAWMDAVASVSGPLGAPSSDGDAFPGESIPMEPL